MTGDLWQAISEAWNATQRNFSIPEMMDSWTLQMGYPIIIFEQQNSTNIYTIKQERFLKAFNVSIHTKIELITFSKDRLINAFSFIDSIKAQTNNLLFTIIFFRLMKVA